MAEEKRRRKSISWSWMTRRRLGLHDNNYPIVLSVDATSPIAFRVSREADVRRSIFSFCQPIISNVSQAEN
jgi:hypothetical protein